MSQRRFLPRHGSEPTEGASHDSQRSLWREAPRYTVRGRAALGWTEALTRHSEGHTHEHAYDALKAHFTEEEQIKLTLMYVVRNPDKLRHLH